MRLTVGHSVVGVADQRARVSYRLEELVNTIVASAGGDVSPSFQLTLKGKFCSLDWDYDVKPLTCMYGKLSNHMLEWVRTWFNPQIDDVKCHICSPYLIPILEGFLNLQPNERLQVFVDFIHDKYPALPPTDITTLIVPYTCGKQWTVYILGDQGFFHFDSMRGAGLHVDPVLRTRLGKL